MKKYVCIAIVLSVSLNIGVTSDLKISKPLLYIEDETAYNFNPFSAVAFRPFGGWHGVRRVNAYETRLVKD